MAWYEAGDTKSASVVKQMEKEWPEMTKEFKRLQHEQYVLFLHKQHDYGPGNISVGSQLTTPEEIKLSLTGLWFRMRVKVTVRVKVECLVKGYERTPKAQKVHVSTYVRECTTRGKTKTPSQRIQDQAARNTARVRRIEEGLKPR